jgi:aminomethyltransferase
MAESSDLKSVPLNDRHVALGGRMVPFAGYALPVQYADGIIAEHKWTREHAGLFDVSHMGPAFLELASPSGDAEADHAAVSALVEPLICGDIAGLKPGRIRYTLLLNETGGTLDDLMVARSPRFAGTLYVVVNAATKEADFARIEAAASDKAKFTRADDGALLALQGPEAAAVIAGIVPEAANLAFMSYGSWEWNGTRLMVSRSGYTGEDGFEILVAADRAGDLWDVLLGDPRVKPIGLGARDSLRLEAGLPLYGHDLDETVSPIEAGLNFAVSKRRREAADFPGAARILKEYAGENLARVRVGLLVEGAPAREGAEILDASGNTIGRVTSGGFSPSLGRAIALGFVPPSASTPGTALQVSVRGRAQKATVTELPFVPHRYFR